MITGNPSSDSGWAAGGNSLDSGTYIRLAGNFSFDTYYTNFVLDAASPLLGSGWAIGDEIIAMGGTLVPNSGLAVDTGWGTDGFTGDAVNSNVSGSIRIVSKFGTSPTAWAASTIKPNAGNGQGSTSSGHGGDGAVLIGTAVSDITAGNANTVQIASVQERYPAPGFVGVTLTDMGKYIYNVDGNNLLSSWETFLNVTQLAASLPINSEVPQAGDRYNQALQRSTNSTLITDALIASVPVPEPSTWMLAIAGAAGLVGLKLKRKSRSDS
ncbi:MAG: PEP-CTERM sorting domain-containing protein [Pirellulales bacterium]